MSLSSVQFGITWTRSGETFREVTCLAICFPTTTLKVAVLNDRSRSMVMPLPIGDFNNGIFNWIAVSGYMSCSQLIRKARRCETTGIANSETRGGSVIAMTISPGLVKANNDRQVDK